MKLKQSIVISMVAIAGFTSCEKNLYDPSLNKSEVKIEDLQIADDFGWEMAKASLCTIQSGNNEVTLSIYQDEACSPGKLLAVVPVLPGKTVELPLSLLATSQNIFIQYQNAAGNTTKVSAPVKDGKIEFTVPSETGVRAITRADDNNDKTIISFYPNFDGGTVMFEDNYPELGDYDFNDFVANYSIEINSNANGFINYIDFYMNVNAIGAVKVYIPHFRIKSFGTEVVDRIESNNGEFPDFEPTLINDVKEKIVIALKGGENKFGQDFLNTQKESANTLPRKLNVRIYFKPKKADIKFLDIDKFDLFLATANHTEEIHILGNGPAFKLEGYGDEVDRDGKYYNNYYKMKGSNLIWGINIPERIKHAYEKTDFLFAYPDFAKWAEGNYTITNEWYKNGNSKFLFP